MLNELFHIPEAAGRSVVRWFFHAGVGEVWQPYEIPRNHSMIFIFAVGGAGGGGSGFSAAATNARGGGGGGGGGGLGKFFGPRILLPDVIFVSIGAGGAPGANGNNTYVTVYPSSAVAAYRFMFAGAGVTGGNGTGAAVGGAGGGGSATSGPYGSFGLFISTGNTSGGAGGAIAGGAGTSLTWGGSGLPFSSGAGGGGTTSADFAGGNITGAGLFPTILGGAAGSNNGGDGVGQTLAKEYPFFFSGGAGGGSSNAGNGGNGGNGGLGCGGGGGGGGVVGGTGGAGGNGFVMIESW